jgi:hypothetical protein
MELAMRLHPAIVLTALAAVGSACDRGTGPTGDDAGGLRSSSAGRGASIAGTVYSLDFAPDSALRPLGDAGITLVRVAELPAPVTIGDSIGYVTSGPINCGREGPLAASARTNARGEYSVDGLDRGVYAVAASPPPGAELDARSHCPVFLAADARLELTFYLTPAVEPAGPDPAP